MKPTFLLIGAAKAGSTSLYELLNQQPEIFMTSPKELHYFSFDEVHVKGPEWYESWFADGATAKHRGEASQSYSIGDIFPDTARRIHEYAPDLKLIYIVRNPIERIESLWIQLVCQDPRHPDGFLEARPEIVVDASFNIAVKKQSKALVSSSNYWREIGRFREYFSDDQILVLFFEDFKRDQRSVLEQCCKFLGLADEARIGEQPAHRNASTDHLRPGKLMTLLRATPARRNAYRSVVKLIPQTVRAGISRRFLRRPVEGRPEWDAETFDWVREQLADDSIRFLEHYGKSADFWQLERKSPRETRVVRGG